MLTLYDLILFHLTQHLHRSQAEYHNFIFATASAGSISPCRILSADWADWYPVGGGNYIAGNIQCMDPDWDLTFLPDMRLWLLIYVYVYSWVGYNTIFQGHADRFIYYLSSQRLFQWYLYMFPLFAQERELGHHRMPWEEMHIDIDLAEFLPLYD